MNAKLIKQLALLEPKDGAGMAQKASAICQVHLNPAFGWRIAAVFARARKPFPSTMIGRNHWVFRAYMMCLDPVAYNDPDVEAALLLSQQPGTSAKIKAMLVTGLGQPIHDHLALVAEKAGLPLCTVEAFETLFFNVLDRHEDGLYLSNLAYPDSRLVEFADDYFETTPVPELLLRAGYHYRDLDLVVRLAGLDDKTCVKELVALRDCEPEKELEAHIIGNALLMANSGMLNQRSVGMQRAVTLLAANRSSHQNAMTDEVLASPDELATQLAAAIAAVPPITEVNR